MKNVISYFFFILFLIIASVLSNPYNYLHSQNDEAFLRRIDALKKMNLQAEYNRAEGLCRQDDFSCFLNVFTKTTVAYGPQASYELFSLLSKNNKGPKKNIHELGHQLGKVTANTFGVNLKSFRLCPMNAFYYGCQHGFLIYALSQNNSTKDTAAKICNGDGKIVSEDSVLECYHGIGHGLMMEVNYSVNDAIKECNVLPKQIFRTYCIDGVFMENENAELRNKTKFSPNNPLAPCDGLETQYQGLCYSNHAVYLLTFFNFSKREAIRVCRNMPLSEASLDCAFSFGRIFGDEEYVYKRKDTREFVESALKDCELFEGQQKEFCFSGALGHMINIDFPHIGKNTIVFCSMMNVRWKKECFLEIKQWIMQLSQSIPERAILCKELPYEYAPGCLYRAFVTSREKYSAIYLVVHNSPFRDSMINFVLPQASKYFN